MTPSGKQKLRVHLVQAPDNMKQVQSRDIAKATETAKKKKKKAAKKASVFHIHVASYLRTILIKFLSIFYSL